MCKKSILEFRSINKSFKTVGGVLQILKQTSFTLREKEIVALVGPSGSGKSTLLHIAGLLDTPTKGEVIVNGIKCTKLNDKNRAKIRRDIIGFIYQFHHLLPEFSAIENVVLPQLIQGKSEFLAKKKAEDLLTLVKLENRMGFPPLKLSGGEQVRVAIARALANNPSILLADEPTANLDIDTGILVFSELVKYVKKSGLTALIATHNLDLVKKVDRVLELNHGTVKETSFGIDNKKWL